MSTGAKLSLEGVKFEQSVTLKGMENFHLLFCNKSLCLEHVSQLLTATVINDNFVMF